MPLETELAQPERATHMSPAAAIRDVRRTVLPDHSMWKHLGLHILMPLLIGIGMTLAYLGAFHEPSPHHLPVAVAGADAATEVFAQTLNNQASGKLDVTTVSTAERARELVRQRTLAGAYYPDATTGTATLYLSTAASPTTADVVQQVFQPIAYQQGLLYKIDNVVPTGSGDATGQGIFFILVGLSVGGYAVAIAIGAVTRRHGLLARIVVPVLGAALVSAIVIGIASGVYSIFSTKVWQVWLLSWLYDCLVMWIGVALVPVLKSWTGLAMAVLFVQLNFTSSGGIFQKTLEPGFFAGLNDFWAGSHWLGAATTLIYFPGQGLGTDVSVLAIWGGVGLAAVLVSHLVIHRESARERAHESLRQSSHESSRGAAAPATA